MIEFLKRNETFRTRDCLLSVDRTIRMCLKCFVFIISTEDSAWLQQILAIDHNFKLASYWSRPENKFISKISNRPVENNDSVLCCNNFHYGHFEFYSIWKLFLRRNDVKTWIKTREIYLRQRLEPFRCCDDSSATRSSPLTSKRKNVRRTAISREN